MSCSQLFVEITNSLSKLCEDLKNKKKKEEREDHILRPASCASLLNNPDNLGFVVFFFLRQEENRTEITYLNVGETVAKSQGKGGGLY